MAQSVALQLEQSEQQLEKLAAKNQYSKAIQQFYKTMNKNDETSSEFISNQALRAVFNILLKISYSLFLFGIIFTFENLSLDQQSIILYAHEKRNKSILIFLIIIGGMSLVIIHEIRENTKMLARTKRGFDCLNDILRTIFYILALVLIGPYIFSKENDDILFTSFWLFLISVVLFAVRKIIKWHYFLGNEIGKKQLGPWMSKETQPQTLANYEHFFETLLKNKNIDPTSLVGQRGNMGKALASLKEGLKYLEEQNKLAEEQIKKKSNEVQVLVIESGKDRS